MGGGSGKITVVKGKTPASLSTTGVSTIQIPLPEGFDGTEQMLGIRIAQYIYMPYAAGNTINVAINNAGVYLYLLPSLPSYLLNADVFITLYKS